MRGLFRRVFAAAGVMSSAALLFAQQAPPPQQPTPPVFRAGVELVALDVTVVDRDGKPVTGLKPEDFVVTLAGQPRPVRTFDYATFGAAPPSESTATSRETTNDISRAATTSRGGRIVIVLIDDLAARAGQGKALTVAAERMVGTLDLSNLVGLATTSGQGPVLTPTRDRAALLAVLKSKGVVGRKEDVTAPVYVTVPEAIATDRYMPGGRVPEEVGDMISRECAELGLGEACPSMVLAAARRLYTDTIHRTASQLSAYKTIITALKAAPQPRVVIALSTGLMPNIDGSFDLKQVSLAAAEAGVQFYAMVEVGDDVDASDRTGARAKARREEAEVLTSGVQVLAAAAGGEAFRVIGQADRFFKRIIAETSGVYRLGVDAPTTGQARPRHRRQGQGQPRRRHGTQQSPRAGAIGGRRGRADR